MDSRRALAHHNAALRFFLIPAPLPAPLPDPNEPSPAPATRSRRRRSSASQEAFRRELLDHAWTLYRAGGIEAVSIRAMTQAFGMSPMAFYAYFPSKQALLKQIWVGFFHELYEALLAAGRGRRPPFVVLEAHAQAYLGYWEAHPERYRLVYLSNDGQHGSQQIDHGDDPVYERLIALGRDRVSACGDGRLPHSAAQIQHDLMLAKALGYLHLTLVLGRYPAGDRDRLRRVVVEDMLAGVERGVAGG